jgi:hypothetical protein
MVRFEDTKLMSVVGMSHDDVWLLIPFNGIWDLCDSRYDLRLWKERIIEIMRHVPDWAPGLPLDADCKIGETYS